MGKILRGVIACSVMLILVAPWSRADSTGTDKNFLWKVQGNGGTVFLFGSLHLAKADTYPLARQIEESFDASATLALEADPTAAMGSEMQQRMVVSALYTGNDTIRQHLSQGTYDLASRELARVGLPIEQFAKSKPWLLAMTIEVLELQQLGYSPEYGIDLYFAGKAHGKKKIVELESFDSQINLLNGFSDREQELFLLSTIKDMGTIRDDMDGLMRAWRTGDTKSMEQFVTRSLTDYPDTKSIFEKLYYQRNREMAGRIGQFLKGGERCFAVVGAAHLVGKEGIIEILKRKGYRVEQL